MGAKFTEIAARQAADQFPGSLESVPPVFPNVTTTRQVSYPLLFLCPYISSMVNLGTRRDARYKSTGTEGVSSSRDTQREQQV